MKKFAILSLLGYFLFRVLTSAEGFSKAVEIQSKAIDAMIAADGNIIFDQAMTHRAMSRILAESGQ